MKKIITKEERMQLLEHGVFLEGYFNAINSLGTVTWSQVIVVLGVGALLIYIEWIPKKEFQLIREKEECGPVNIFGVEHVPHVNAFRLKENEVIFHSRLSEDNMTIDLRRYGWKSRRGNRLPTAIFVYEWNGEEYDLKLYWIGRVRRWTYGDVLYKKRKKFIVGEPQYYFVSKHDHFSSGDAC